MIEFQHVSFRYPEGGEGGLHDVSLTIPDGQRVLLCGRSGCGKTTLTRLVNGLIPQFFPGELTGRVLLDGEDLAALPMYRISEKVGSVFQNPRTQFFNVDSDSEIAFGLESQARPAAELRARVDRTAEELGIRGLLGRSLFALSGGEKQRVLIARAIALRAAELDAAHADTYLAAADAYDTQIDALDQDFRDFFETSGCKTLIFGDRFPLRYFAAAYGLTCYAAFPGCATQTEPSAATVAFLTEKVESEGISTVFYIEFSNHLVADSIAEAAGARTALFHSCHNVSRQDLENGATYLTLMRRNLETLKASLP